MKVKFKNYQISHKKKIVILAQNLKNKIIITKDPHAELQCRIFQVNSSFLTFDFKKLKFHPKSNKYAYLKNRSGCFFLAQQR